MRQQDHHHVWDNDTLGELVQHASASDGWEEHGFVRLFRQALAASDKASLDVFSFTRSVNFMMRLGKRNQAVISMKPQDVAGMVYGVNLPSLQQLRAMSKVANIPDDTLLILTDALIDVLTSAPQPPVPSGRALSQTATEQSEIVAFSAAERERLRRIAGASSMFERF
jgi:hypothetical protein